MFGFLAGSKGILEGIPDYSLSLSEEGPLKSVNVVNE
jgi:hypothetical protein